MSFTGPSIYDTLPADPEQAFLVLEQKYRAELEEDLSRSNENTRADVSYVTYIAQVLAAISALELESRFRQDVPQIEDVDYSTYVNFSKDVTHYVTQLKIRQGRRAQGFSVKFDQVAKDKVRHFLTQARELVAKMEIDEKKRDSMLKKISALELEIDRTRARYDAFADLVIETAGVAGEAAERMEPVRRLLNSIAGVIWGTKQEEEARRLPPPETPKRIEPPKFEPGSSRAVSSDDEIPF